MRLNQVSRHCSDLQRSLGFYRQLGLELLACGPQRAHLRCPQGDTTFSLQEVALTNADTHSVVYFECDALDQTVENLRAAGLAFDSLPQEQPWRWREAWLRDPDGHPVCLYYAGMQRLQPAADFDSALG